MMVDNTTSINLAYIGEKCLYSKDLKNVSISRLFPLSLHLFRSVAARFYHSLQPTQLLKSHSHATCVFCSLVSFTWTCTFISYYGWMASVQPPIALFQCRAFFPADDTPMFDVHSSYYIAIFFVIKVRETCRTCSVAWPCCWTRAYLTHPNW